MSSNNKFHNSVWPCVVLLSLFIIHTPAHAISIGFDPVSSSVTLDDSFDVDIVISGLGDGEEASVSAFDIDVSYDSAVLDATAVIFGSLLGGGPLLSFQDAIFNPGFVDIAELSLLSSLDLDALQASSFTLATVTFHAIGIGDSLLNIPTEDMLPIVGLDIKDAFGFELDVTSIAANVTVEPRAVPVPGALPLLVIGLVSLMGRICRKAS